MNERYTLRRLMVKCTTAVVLSLGLGTFIALKLPSDTSTLTLNIVGGSAGLTAALIISVTELVIDERRRRREVRTARLKAVEAFDREAGYQHDAE